MDLHEDNPAQTRSGEEVNVHVASNYFGAPSGTTESFDFDVFVLVTDDLTGDVSDYYIGTYRSILRVARVVNGVKSRIRNAHSLSDLQF